MKIGLILLFVSMGSIYASAYSQNREITLNATNTSLKEVIKQIEIQSDYTFFYNENYIDLSQLVSLTANKKDIEVVLTSLCLQAKLNYKFMENNLVVITSETQQKQLKVSGKVTDEDGQPLVGVSVSLKGSNQAVITDFNGSYSISITAKDKALVFSFIGMKRQEVIIEGRSIINVVMENETSTLDEVVIIGYQSVRRRDITGAVSSINSQQIKDIPVNSTLEALTGRLAGVQIVTTDGAPGSDAEITVRGGVSITQDNSPLYVIDGVQVENGLSYIAPQDIETVDVLKDASSTAIYGARGANGVVIITTKSGKEARTTVSINSFLGVRKLANELPVMSPYDFVTYQSERTRGSLRDSTSFANTYGSNWSDLDKYKNSTPIDWQKEVFGRNAMMQTQNVSISGGTKATQFNLSATYNKEEGILIYTGFERKLVNFKFDHTANEKLKLGFSARYNNQLKDGGGTNTEGGTQTGKMSSTIKYRPFNTNSNLGIDEFDSQYYDETNLAGNSLGLTNPVVMSKISYRKTYIDAVNLGGYLTYTFNKFLSFKSTIGFDINIQRNDAFDDTLTNNSRKNAAGTPIVRVINGIVRTLNNSNVLTFSNARLSSGFHRKNSINFLLGQESYISKSKRNDIQLGYYPIGIVPEKALGQLSLGTPFPLNPVTTEYESGIFSAFSKIDYVYDRKYSASFSLRADASSKFASGRRVGYFPAGTISWRISQEKFMQKIPFINDMKLRISYGESGNNRISDYLYFTTMSSYLSSGSTPISYGLNGTNVAGYVSGYLANPFLQWEKAISRNIGLDLNLFHNRVQLTVDAYQNDGKDLLVNAPIPSTSGYASQLQNIGTTTNNGVEIQLTSNIINKKNFSWTANFNLSFNRNTIKKLAGNQSSYLQSSGWGFSGSLPDYLVKEGESVGTIYGFVSDGFYTLNDFDYDASTSRYTVKPGVVNTSYFGIPQPGYIKLKDLNGDHIVDPDNDRKVLGNTNPKFFGGLNQQFTYSNFDLSVFLNFSYGNKILNASKIEYSNSYNVGTNLLATMNGRWRTVDANGNLLQQVVSSGGIQYVVGAAPEVLAAANPNPTIWSPIRTGNYAIAVTSWAVEDGSFLRVNNITLGYTLSPKILAKLKIKNLRVYTTLSNLAVLTKYTGSDPEVNTQRSSPLTPGVDYSAYPRSHSYIFGFNLSL